MATICVRHPSVTSVNVPPIQCFFMISLHAWRLQLRLSPSLAKGRRLVHVRGARQRRRRFGRHRHPTERRQPRCTHCHAGHTRRAARRASQERVQTCSVRVRRVTVRVTRGRLVSKFGGAAVNTVPVPSRSPIASRHRCYTPLSQVLTRTLQEGDTVRCCVFSAPRTWR